MLCVALVAFVTLEQVSPAHAATDPCFGASAPSTTGEVAQAIMQGDTAEDDANGPSDQQQQQQQRHHCCGAHTSSTPPLAHAGVPLQLSEMLVPARRSDAALDSAPMGLERPPKAAAIV